MQVTDARKMSAAEIAALMKKKAFDEVELSPRIQAGTDAMFGRHMTAAQVVDQIVADVRKNGDESLFYYTKLIDRVELTPENIRVTEEEFAEAEAIVKPEVKAALESRCRKPGLRTVLTVHCWGKRLPRLIPSVFMFPAALLLILRL